MVSIDRAKKKKLWLLTIKSNISCCWRKLLFDNIKFTHADFQYCVHRQILLWCWTYSKGKQYVRSFSLTSEGKRPTTSKTKQWFFLVFLLHLILLLEAQQPSIGPWPTVNHVSRHVMFYGKTFLAPPIPHLEDRIFVLMTRWPSYTLHALDISGFRVRQFPY
jgi:hypothetical protein